MKTHGRNCTVLSWKVVQRPHLLQDRFMRSLCPAVLAVRTARLSLRSSNNAYFLPLIYFCPGIEIQVMSVVPGIELLGQSVPPHILVVQNFYTTDYDRCRSGKCTAGNY
jgi:hypothetical protein